MRNLFCLVQVFVFIFYSCSSETSVNNKREAEVLLNQSPDQFINWSDSALKSSLRENPADLLEHLLLRQQAFSKIGLQDSVLSIGVWIRALALEVGDSMSIAKSLLPIRGNISLEQQMAFEPFLGMAQRIFHKQKMRYEEGVILSLLGFVETKKANIETAVKHLQQSRSILEELDSTRALYPVMLNLGNGYSGLRQFSEAGKYYRRSFELARKLKDSIRMSISMQSLATLAQAKNETDSTIYLLKTSASYLPSSAGVLSLQLQYNLAYAYFLDGSYEEAEKIYRSVLNVFQQMSYGEGVAMARRGLALVKGKKGALSEAIALMDLSIRQLDSAGNRIQMVEQYEELVDLYKKSGQTDKALAAMIKMKHLSDSLFSVEKSKAVKELEVKYQTEKKEEENRTLRQQIRFRNAVAAISIILLFVSGLLVVILRQRNRYQHDLNRTYARLTEKYLKERDEAMHRLETIRSAGLTEADSGELKKSTADNGPEVVNRKAFYEDLLRLFQEEKVYLDPSLKAEDVASRLGVSARKLAAELKDKENVSFSQFLNRYRIAEASRLLEDQESKLFKLDVIATLSGFTNRQHFRRVFEQVTGVNPGYFREATGRQPLTDDENLNMDSEG